MTQIRKSSELLHSLVKGLVDGLGNTPVSAYLVMMTPRLLEIHRVLKPAGSLLAATNSEEYMPEIVALQNRLVLRLGTSIDNMEEKRNPMIGRFSLENGQRILKSVFADADRHDLESALVFTESEPLVAYLGTMKQRYEALLPGETSWEEVSAVLKEEIDRKIKDSGEFRVTKLAGVFVARKK